MLRQANEAPQLELSFLQNAILAVLDVRKMQAVQVRQKGAQT